MSITHIKTNKKIEVLLRLLQNNESLEDASSKAGLNIEKNKTYCKKYKFLIKRGKNSFKEYNLTYSLWKMSCKKFLLEIKTKK